LGPVFPDALHGPQLGRQALLSLRWWLSASPIVWLSRFLRLPSLIADLLSWTLRRGLRSFRLSLTLATVCAGPEFFSQNVDWPSDIGLNDGHVSFLRGVWVLVYPLFLGFDVTLPVGGGRSDFFREDCVSIGVPLRLHMFCVAPLPGEPALDVF